MNFAAFCLCLSLSTGSGSAPQDAWFAEDKLKHFFASFVATSLSASAARTAGLDAEVSMWVGAGMGTGVGVWKELRDARVPGETASVKDLVWDVMGVGAASAMMSQVR